MAHSPPPKLGYLPNHCDALRAHMHFLHKLGNAKTESNYHAYYQTLIKDGTANGAISNAYLTSSDVPFKTKCIIMKYRTGTLYTQKHAVLFKLSTSQTCPLCPQLDSALHILSECQHTQIRNMITKRHNLACCTILKAISYQQNRLLRIMHCLQRYRQQRTDDYAKSPDSWNSWT
jgi:hypothetical protein